jgi:hypothetical protein
VSAFTVRVDASATIAALDDLQRSQLPYAEALALTRTAQEAVPEIQRRLHSTFILRNTWTERGVRYEPAQKKQNNPTAWVTFVRQYMYLQEVGGEKRSRRGGYIAVPVAKELRGRTIIRANMRPKWLLGMDAKAMAPAKSARYAKALRERQATYAMAFVRVRGGKRAIFLRVNDAGQPDADGRHLKLMYVLVPMEQIHKRLRMYETVRDVAGRSFKQHFEYALRQAMATMRR